MKYKITCDNCDYEFLTTGESRQTVQCQCPNCGGQMKVKLPAPTAAATKAAFSESSESSESSEKSDFSEQSEPRRRTGCGIIVGIFLGLFLLVLIAMVAYSLTRHENTQRVEDPYARIIDDSTYYKEGYVEEETQPDTVEQHIVKHEETPDTAVHHESELLSPEEALTPEHPEVSEPSASSEKSEHSEPSEHSEHPESSPTQQKTNN